MKSLRLSLSTLLLILSNLVPLYGAIFAGWNVFSIMILYWLESAVIGGFTILKMIYATGSLVDNAAEALPAAGGNSVEPLAPSPLAAKLFFVPFFCIHYGLFMLVHLIFLISFFGRSPAAPLGEQPLDFGGVAIGFLSLVVSHGASFWTNFIAKKEYKVLSAAQLLMSPYPRIMVMHFTVLLGGFFVLGSGQAVGALVVMILLKIIVDLSSHLFEHGQIAKRLI